MTLPSVTLTELDGQLGILPPSEGELAAFVGISSSGTANTPATYARVTDITADFGDGPMVEAAAHYIERYGRPVVLVRTTSGTDGAYSAISTTGAGTSVVTASGTLDPYDDYEVYVVFLTGATIGVAGATYKYSLDGGRTLSATQALGTANTITLPGNVGLDFAAGTVLAGQTISARTSAPIWSATTLGDALEALTASTVTWGICHVVGDIAAAGFDEIETQFAAMAAAGKYRAWVGNTRMPNAAESESTYLSALTTIFSAKATTRGNLCAGACQVRSSVSGRRYRRPVAFVVGAKEQSVSHEVNIADINLGPLPCSIRDENGNPLHHDEAVNPGLDDARFTSLRTHDGIQGVYATRSRCLSAAGSDFRLFTHRRVLNIADAALRAYFLRRLNKPIRVNATTGFIREQDALEIEAGARAALRTALLAKPKASAVSFVLSRTDNLLSTSTMTGEARVTPLAYPEFITLQVGFLNPALQTVTA